MLRTSDAKGAKLRTFTGGIAKLSPLPQQEAHLLAGRAGLEVQVAEPVPAGPRAVLRVRYRCP